MPSKFKIFSCFVALFIVAPSFGHCSANSLENEGDLENTNLAPSVNTSQAHAISDIWTPLDVGQVGIPGSEAQAGDEIIVTGSGADIAGAEDEFHFTAVKTTGDCDIQTEVTYVEDTSKWAKAGLLIRETPATDSAYAAIFVTANNGISFQFRATNGTKYAYLNSGGKAAPYWLRLVRIGNLFAGYISINGSAWSQLGTSREILMPPLVYSGLAVTSHDNQTLCTATFSNTSLASLPSPWHKADLGNGGFTGIATHSAGSYDIVASGAGFRADNDSACYIYQDTAGDVALSAERAYLTKGACGAGALMIRETLNPNSRFAAIMIDSDRRITFVQRADTGGAVRAANTAYPPAAAWLRLARAGTVFTAAYSSDGQSWTTLDHLRMDMANSFSIGFCAFSHDNTTNCRVSLRHVKVSPETP